jgi:cardiolipin synthase
MTVLVAILWVLLCAGFTYQILHSQKDPDLLLFWLLIFALAPPLAAIIYCLAGINYRRPYVRERLHSRTRDYFARQITPELRERFFSDSAFSRVEDAYRPLAELLLSCGEGNKVYADNSYEIITSGLRKRELLLEDIRNARKYIHIEYFRFGNDRAGREVRDLLAQKAAEGVEVRFVNNNMIGRFIPRSYFRKMGKMGIEVRPYTHIRYGWRTWLMRINCQNHRKIVVIDGKVAYTGGMNLNDNYFYRWRDTHLRVEGPVIARLQASFIDTWMTCGGVLSHPLAYYFDIPAASEKNPLRGKLLQVVTDAAEDPWPTTLLGYEWILQNARKYIYIQTPYFIPPVSFLNALKSAALRGVDVQVMLPKVVDTPLAGTANRSVYEECLEAGIRIYERSGAFIHSKTLVADDSLCVIGASNLDMRSFHLNSEVNTFVYDRETALVCKSIFQTDQEQAKCLQLEEWKKGYPWYKSLMSSFVRMFYRLF